MKISGDTKISSILRSNPAALEAIVSISAHFEKLRNPLLRKILASRVTITDASRIGGCKPEDFFRKLEELGFETDNKLVEDGTQEKQEKTEMIIFEEKTLTLDVRTELAEGRDPFHLIMKNLNELPGDNVLMLINSFEPTPLLKILDCKGFTHYSRIRDGVSYTYIQKPAGTQQLEMMDINKPIKKSFATALEKFAGRIKVLDVTGMEMPWPMVTILTTLEELPNGTAVHVLHRKIPQMLLPELEERGYEYLLEDINDHRVELLIYRTCTPEA